MKKRLWLIFSISILLFKVFAQNSGAAEVIASETPDKASETEVLTATTEEIMPPEEETGPEIMSPRDAILFYPGPALMLQSVSKGIGWITEEELYLITDNEALVLNSVTNQKEDIPVESGKIIFARTAHNTISGQKEFYTLTDNNVAGIRTLPLTQRYPQKYYETESKVTATAFSPNGLYIAFGTLNGQISLAMKLQYTRQIYHTKLFIKPSEVKQLSFNQTSDKLLTVSKDGSVDIWDLTVNDVVSSMKVPKRNKFPVYFCPDSEHIISAENKHKIIFRTMDGTVVKELTLQDPMGSYRISSDGKYLYELASNNNIYVYNLNTLKLEGYIPYFSNSEIMDYDFSQDYTKILVTHKDGLVFILNIADVFLSPDAPQPKLGKGTYSGGSGAGNGSGSVAGDVITSSMGIHNVEMRLEISKPNNPYAINLDPQIGYVYKKPFQPFYFGGMLEFPFCIPDPSFPYAYVDLNTGHTLHSPYLLGPKITGTAGLFFKPFPKDIGVFVEARPSFSIYTFWFPKYGFQDKYPSFSLELQGGITWRQMSFMLGGLYDYRLGFSFSATMGWRIKAGAG